MRRRGSTVQRREQRDGAYSDVPFAGNGHTVKGGDGPRRLGRADSRQREDRVEVSGRRAAESFSSGLNAPLLRALAAAGGGTYDAVERMSGVRPLVAGGRIDLWPYAAALGCLAYLAAILARRVDP